mmetsp:Transcript_2090/g.5733  ORF Transcript_2090/g.5733 Transcript_2090/m.5733 type:complete len:93 (-) Transcript_2090:121-399(-)
MLYSGIAASSQRMSHPCSLTFAVRMRSAIAKIHMIDLTVFTPHAAPGPFYWSLMVDYVFATCDKFAPMSSGACACCLYNYLSLISAGNESNL